MPVPGAACEAALFRLLDSLKKMGKNRTDTDIVECIC